jgi:hypothetical protein
MPARHPIALNSIELMFAAMEEEAHCKLQFKADLYRRYILHKIRYYLYLVGFKYLQISSPHQYYLLAIDCIESVLDFAVKAYLIDRRSFREPDR